MKDDLYLGRRFAYEPSTVPIHHDRTSRSQVLIRVASILIAMAVSCLRFTVKIRYHDDPRETFRKNGRGYLFSFLHAHQLGLILGSEKGTGAMVSRSKDGELIVPLLLASGCIPVRGSKRSHLKERGGREAIHTLTEHVQRGKPAAIAVDGPRGPRGKVHKGIASLSQQTGAPVLNLVAVSRRKITLSRAWDRMQIPLPFTVIDGYFAEPIHPIDGERLETYRQRIEASLHALETMHDPFEASYNGHVESKSEGIVTATQPTQDFDSVGDDFEQQMPEVRAAA